jgi:hypothetical protein
MVYGLGFRIESGSCFRFLGSRALRFRGKGF